MRKRCTQAGSTFASEGTLVECASRFNYVFKDNGSKVLGVAHIDTVLPHLKHIFNHQRFAARAATKKYASQPAAWRVHNTQLDDRLGVWILLDVLPMLGVHCDILLTDGEEVGQSSGKSFQPPAGKEYNWMFQFDRMGTNVVMYRYDTEELRNLLKASGFNPGYGSFSDISAMEHLGISGFNFGTGYYQQHTSKCWADLYDTFRMVRKFVKFYHVHKDRKLAYVPQPEPEFVWKQSSYTSELRSGSYTPTGNRFWETSNVPPLKSAGLEIASDEEVEAARKRIHEMSDAQWAKSGHSKPAWLRKLEQQEAANLVRERKAKARADAKTLNQPGLFQSDEEWLREWEDRQYGQNTDDEESARLRAKWDLEREVGGVAAIEQRLPRLCANYHPGGKHDLGSPCESDCKA